MPSIKTSVGKRFQTESPPISLDDACELLSMTTEKDELGQAIETEKPFLVFCSKLDVTRAEFSTAGQLGHKPNFMLLVDADSYDNEQHVRYQKQRYSVYKTFQRWDGFTELYCELKKNDRH